MKNVRENQLKKCIFLEEEEFTNILREVFEDDTIHVGLTLEGIDYYTDIEENEKLLDNNDEINGRLSKYFDCNVTSIHIDDCDYVGIWVVYR